MFSISLRLIPEGGQTANLRLVYVRGSAPLETLRFEVSIADDSTLGKRDSDKLTPCRQGILVAERGIKRSTEKGVLYLGFLNDINAFWGETSSTDEANSFQVYIYLPEDMFDRITDLAKLGKLPAVTIDIGENQGLSRGEAPSGPAVVWNSVEHPSIRLESVRVDFGMNCSA